MRIRIARIIAGTVLVAAVTAADPEARYALFPGDDRPPAAQLTRTR